AEPARVVAAADAGRAVTLKPALPQFQLPLRVAAYLFKKGAPPEEAAAGIFHAAATEMPNLVRKVMMAETGDADDAQGVDNSGCDASNRKVRELRATAATQAYTVTAMSRMSRRYGWCPVCLEDLMGLEDMLFRRETVVLIPCSHLVHEDCLEKFSCTRSHRACPECSRPVQATVSV
ncbi:Cyt-b5, partial [Symbiodinium sp. CCMP2456]